MGQHGQQGAERNQWLLQTFIRQAQCLLSITEGERPQLEHFVERHTSDLRSVNVSFLSVFVRTVIHGTVEGLRT